MSRLQIGVFRAEGRAGWGAELSKASAGGEGKCVIKRTERER